MILHHGQISVVSKSTQEKTEMQMFCRRKLKCPNIIINNKNITYVKDKMILVLIFDSPKLIWKSHLTYLHGDGIRRVAMMKSIASNNCGASYHILKISIWLT